MAVVMLKHDYTTGYSEFSYDTESDVDKLPRINVAGKDNLNTIKGC